MTTSQYTIQGSEHEIRVGRIAAALGALVGALGWLWRRGKADKEGR